MTAATLVTPVVHHHERCIDHLLWLASRERDARNWEPARRDVEREHIFNGVIATVSAVSRASGRASDGITLAGRWEALVRAVDARETYSTGDLHAREVLHRDVTDDEAADRPVSQECRDRLDQAVMDAARDLYFGGVR